jgi:short subunit dehydrogenase-like uncharacterized protein
VGGEREFDIILFGATSFVGRLTAEYLARAAPPDVNIALAGRSRERLSELQSSLAGAGAGAGSEAGAMAAGEWPLLVADTGDEASIKELAARAGTILTTVGPYRSYGLPVVRACAEAGTHYADLTGEVVFMRESIDRFGALAAETGARIVHSCGFDSVPSDLGVLLLHEQARADGTGELEETTLVVRAMKGGASGGTIASMKGALADARGDRRLARLLTDPYGLSPDRDSEPDLGREGDPRGPQHDRTLGMWVGPFIMGTVNTRVVRRSNAILDWAYGRSFRYREVVGFGSGGLASVQAGALAAGVGALAAGLSIGPTRALLDRVLPAPGEGPSESRRRSGFFRIAIHTRTSQGAHYVCRVAAQGDPGYQATSVMFGESGLSLALDGERLPERAGVLTPATAIGGALADRLRAAGQTYAVERID